MPLVTPPSTHGSSKPWSAGGISLMGHPGGGWDGCLSHAAWPAGCLVLLFIEMTLNCTPSKLRTPRPTDTTIV